MALGGIYEVAGSTITIDPDRVSVIAVGSLFTPIIEIGDWLFCNGQVGLIGAVIDDTRLTLESQWQGTLPSAAPYVIVKMSWLRYDPALTQAKVRELLEHLQAEGHFLFVEGDAPDPAMGEDGQWALKTDISPWGLWYKDDGVWLAQAPPAGIKWRGAWSSAINYGPGEGVEHLGSSYISRTSHINQPPASNPDDWDLAAAKGNTGSTGPTGPPGMVWRGAWSSATAYLVNDAVGHLGASYIAILAHTNQAPPNATYWNLLAQQGTAVIVDDSITPPMLDADTAAKQEAFRVRLDAAPFDAMAYNGMQVNGSFDVSQELGTGGKTTDGYFCDGWRTDHAGSSLLTSIVTSSSVTPGIANTCAVLVTTAQASIGASDYALISTRIEGYRTARLGWGVAGAQPITIGFWSWHTRPGIYSVGVRNSAGNRSYFTTYTQNLGAVPEYKTVTIPGDVTGTWDAGNGTGIMVRFAMACGSTFIVPAANTWQAGSYFAAPGQVNGVATTSDVFRITGVVVLPGTQAPTAAQSPLIMRPYDQELVTCQRYYYKWLGNGATNSRFALAYFDTASSCNFIASLPVPMRITPTLATSVMFVNGVAPGSSAVLGMGGNIVSLSFTGIAGTVGQVAQVYGGTNSYVALDARL